MKRRVLGQHYLIDRDIINRILTIADLRHDEVVLEIGTGRGELTVELSKRCLRLEGYEIDRENFVAVKNVCVGRNVRLHMADAFKHKHRFDVLVSSLPYSRSSDFIEWISQIHYKRAVVLLQEDFARKITAPPGTRNYRAMSVIAQLSSKVRLWDRVPTSAFSPPPKVSSMLVEFEPVERLDRTTIDMIKRVFSLRRRTLGSVLRRYGLPYNDDMRRVYTLSPEEVFEIVKELKEKDVDTGRRP